MHPRQPQSTYATFRIDLTSPAAQGLADLIWPTVIRLSFWPPRARRCLPQAEYNQAIRDIEAVLGKAQAALAAEDADLARRQFLAPARSAINLHYGPAVLRQAKCATPWARTLLKLLHRLLTLHEAWLTFAWQVDAAWDLAPDRPRAAQYAIYEQKYREWQALLRNLRSQLQTPLARLQQACRSRDRQNTEERKV